MQKNNSWTRGDEEGTFLRMERVKEIKVGQEFSKQQQKNVLTGITSDQMSHSSFSISNDLFCKMPMNWHIIIYLFPPHRRFLYTVGTVMVAFAVPGEKHCVYSFVFFQAFIVKIIALQLQMLISPHSFVFSPISFVQHALPSSVPAGSRRPLVSHHQHAGNSRYSD